MISLREALLHKAVLSDWMLRKQQMQKAKQ